jgi:hypothetical protein
LGYDAVVKVFKPLGVNVTPSLADDEGRHSLPGGVTGLVTCTVLAVINWCVDLTARVVAAVINCAVI